MCLYLAIVRYIAFLYEVFGYAYWSHLNWCVCVCVSGLFFFSLSHLTVLPLKTSLPGSRLSELYILFFTSGYLSNPIVCIVVINNCQLPYKHISHTTRSLRSMCLSLICLRLGAHYSHRNLIMPLGTWSRIHVYINLRRLAVSCLRNFGMRVITWQASVYI